MQCLPDSLLGRVYYEPAARGFERELGERLQQLKKRRNKGESSAD
ncbi:MAG: hypothetical protein WB992_12675 [Bryobacteraceae bacterium]